MMVEIILLMMDDNVAGYQGTMTRQRTLSGDQTGDQIDTEFLGLGVPDSQFFQFSTRVCVEKLRY